MGYWYRDAPDASLPEELRTFLQAGEKPILLALGAMSFECGEEREKLDLFVRAFEETGHRAVLQGFQETLKTYPLPANMLAVGSVPHSLLFPLCHAVIHHCGFGTAAAALIYGVPSIPVPHVLDQMGFADRLHRLQVSTKPLPAGKLSQEAVAEAVRALDADYPGLSARARELSFKIAAEDGLC